MNYIITDDSFDRTHPSTSKKFYNLKALLWKIASLIVRKSKEDLEQSHASKTGQGNG